MSDPLDTKGVNVQRKADRKWLTGSGDWSAYQCEAMVAFRGGIIAALDYTRFGVRPPGWQMPDTTTLDAFEFFLPGTRVPLDSLTISEGDRTGEHERIALQAVVVAMHHREVVCPFEDALDGFEYLMAEVSRTWTHVRRDKGVKTAAEIGRMRASALSVAALALRFVHDVCDAGRGRV